MSVRGQVERVICPHDSHAAYREAADALEAYVSRRRSDWPDWGTTVLAEYMVETLSAALDAVVEAERRVNIHINTGKCRA